MLIAIQKVAIFFISLTISRLQRKWKNLLVKFARFKKKQYLCGENVILWHKLYVENVIFMCNHLPENVILHYATAWNHDTGLLIASLDEEAQEDLRANKNFGTYKGAIYENVVGEMLRKSGYEQLYFYRHDNPSLEMDFFVRDANSLVPIEVKARDGATASLNNLIKWESYPDIHYGIKLGYKNIGWNGAFYTFPYFLTFLLKRFLAEKADRHSTY